MPLGSFLPGRSGSRILFRNKFRTNYDWPLSAPEGVIWMMETFLLQSSILPFQFVEPYRL